MRRRPVGIWVACVGLLAVSLGAMSIGALMTFISGMTPPADPLFAMVGLAVAAACAAAAVGAWAQRLSRGVALALAASAPAACIAGGFEGSDFQGLAVMALCGWLGLAALLHRSAPAAWLGARRPREPVPPATAAPRSRPPDS